MKKTSLVLIGMVFALLSGCDNGSPTAPRSEPVASVPAPPVAAKSPGAEPTSASREPPVDAWEEESAEQRHKVLEHTRSLMDQTTAYLQQGKLDLARSSLKELQAKRDSLPEFLQVQVDHLQVLVDTNAGTGPLGNLKAAVLTQQAKEAQGGQ